MVDKMGMLPHIIKSNSERTGLLKREEETDQNTRFTGVPPIPSTKLPIQTGVSVLTASGGGVGSSCGPLVV